MCPTLSLAPSRKLLSVRFLDRQGMGSKGFSFDSAFGSAFAFGSALDSSYLSLLVGRLGGLLLGLAMAWAVEEALAWSFRLDSERAAVSVEW